MRHLIINADGYGFTAGTTRAIEECIAFGTVSSISVNVNFAHAASLAALVKRHPGLSVGCHVNPIVGPPLLGPEKVPTLVNEKGEFLYRAFARRFLSGLIRLEELRAEMTAQIEKTRELAGEAFSHVDFHMGLHRLPTLYRLFLDVAAACDVRRTRAHTYVVGMESRFPRLCHAAHLMKRPARVPKWLWNYCLKAWALSRGMALPDRRVEITGMASRPERITASHYSAMLKNLPDGFSEFVAHPGYVDASLKRWSKYLEPREQELRVLLSAEFRQALARSDVRLAGYRDIPVTARLRRVPQPLRREHGTANGAEREAWRES
ncbi:MAG TPA: ChbG/HpnK family deacetylase [Candidatus Acidoferrales bacterium]|nr:ChbG/HpnK family deacetylase [Candidatus Acidoferrales bacterium]